MDIFDGPPERVRSSGRPQSDSFLFNFVAPFAPASSFPGEPAPRIPDAPERTRSGARLLPPNNLRPELTETLDLSKESQDSLKPKLKFPSSQLQDEGLIESPQLSLPASEGVVQNPREVARKKQKKVEEDRTSVRLVKAENGEEKGRYVTRTKIINNAAYPQIVIIPQKNGRAGGDVFRININEDDTVFQAKPADVLDLNGNLTAGLEIGSPDLMHQLIQSMEENHKIQELEEAIRTQELILQQLGRQTFSIIIILTTMAFLILRK